MENIGGCQLPNVPKLSEGLAQIETQSFLRRVKLSLAVPWNYYVKRWIKQVYRIYAKRFHSNKPVQVNSSQSVLNAQADTQQQQLIDQLPLVESANLMQSGKLNSGDWVRVRTWDEIQPMLDPFKETRGCAFLEDMRKYCGTKQRVLKSMERFLDERDYKVKKVRGVILLENVICNGTPTFGQCDRCCFLFWREEWLEKITE
jgi:hypothetical protein